MSHFGHADTHIQHIVRSFKATGRWTGIATILRPPQGKEYAWPYGLSVEQRASVCRHFTGIEPNRADISADGSIVDIWFDGTSWRSRVV